MPGYASYRSRFKYGVRERQYAADERQGTRTVKLDSMWIRALEGADWVAVHSSEFGGELLEARTPVEMPGDGGTYTMVAQIYEITVFGRTAVYTERPFEVIQRGSF